MELVTSRLRLRPLEDGDLEAMSQMTADPQVMRFVGDGRPLGRAATAAWIANARSGVLANGIGSRAVILRATGELIGWAGLIPAEPNIELIYGLASPYWGKGYATEAARAVLETRNGRVVDATIDPDNGPSRRILDKLGFAVVGLEHDDDGLPTLRLRLI